MPFYVYMFQYNIVVIITVLQIDVLSDSLATTPPCPISGYVPAIIVTITILQIYNCVFSNSLAVQNILKKIPV